MYDKATKVPPPGDPMELFFVLVWKMRQDIEFQKSRATLQALLNQKGAEAKNIEEAFADLKNAFFPYDKNQKKAEIGDMRQRLMREIARGALSVIPTVDPNHRKMQNRLIKGQEKLVQRQKGMIDLSQVTPIQEPKRGLRRR